MCIFVCKNDVEHLDNIITSTYKKTMNKTCPFFSIKQLGLGGSSKKLPELPLTRSNNNPNHPRSYGLHSCEET